MNVGDLIDRLVEDGIASVKSDAHLTDAKKQASIEGFELCRGMKTLEQVEAELDRCTSLQEVARAEIKPQTEDGLAGYWHRRFVTIQVEHVFGVLCVAARHNRWPGNERLPDHLALSGHKTMCYARIAGLG